ncbi:MAG: ABC transporter permease [Bacteroidota bacterium]
MADTALNPSPPPVLPNGASNGAPPPVADDVPVIRLEAKSGWQVIDWKELVAYRDLFRFLVQRDVTVLYKQTVLGYAWAIIRPLVQMVIFTVIFGNMAEVSSDGVPYAIFNYVALVPWTYFSGSLTASTASLVTNMAMLTKVYFPRLVIPMSSVLAKLVDFAIAFVIVFGLMAYYGVAPTWNVVFLPVLILLMIMTAAAAGLWLSALTIQYRDVKHASQFMVQILMYAAPVVWPASLILERFGETAYLVYGIYPLAGIIEGFRAALLGTRAMPWDLIGIGAVSAMFLFVTGALYFKRMERRFADVA